ncbi:MAG: carboxypeptidase regulatory-like domain-containing protein [Acidobacteriota bacterium]
MASGRFLRLFGTPSRHHRSGIGPGLALALAVLTLASWTLGIPQPASCDDLGTARLQIAGTRLVVSPAAQTVPYETPTIVATTLEGYDVGLGTLPHDLRVLGDFVGPELDGVLTLETRPGEPFRIPRLRQKGEYRLENIRLATTSGQNAEEILAFAEPRDVSITATRLLITSVSSRALTLDEIRAHGIVIDDSSYQAMSLTFGFGLRESSFEYELPAVFQLYGPSGLDLVAEPVPTPPRPSAVTGDGVRFQPPQLVPFHIQIERTPREEIPSGGCDVEDGECRDAARRDPPLVGVIAFPTDISLLHQHFSVVLMSQNGAPDGDPLEIRDLTARISVPSALRQAETVPATPLGVPVPMQVPGPDGELGTADDLTVLVAQASAEAEFLLEGLAEGAHVVEFDLDGVLHGLPEGPRPIHAKARGSVAVRDPTLAVTFSHPQAVQAGWQYPFAVTLANLGNVPANDIDFTLTAAGRSNVDLAPGQSATETVGSLLPGESATVEFQVVAQTSGRVVATTARAGSSTVPRFDLELAVQGGIPISPESIVLPRSAEALPPELRRAGLDVAGLGRSLASAPAGIAADLPRLDRAELADRVYRLAQAGRHIDLGEDVFDAVAVLAAEWNGSRDAGWGWDTLRRVTEVGAVFSQRAGEQLAAAEPTPETAFERFAASTYFLGPRGALGVGSDVTLDVASRTTGLASAGWGTAALRDLPFADVLPLDGGAMAILSVVEDGGFRARVSRDTAGSAGLRVLVPGTTLTDAPRIARWTGISLGAGGSAWVDVDTTTRGTDASTLVLQIDSDSDGQVDSTQAAFVDAVAPRIFAPIAARQDLDTDASGHVVDVLFSADVDLASLQPADAAHFTLPGYVSNGGLTPIESHRGGGVLGQPQVENPLAGLANPRVVRVVFDNPIAPSVTDPLTVSNVASIAGDQLTSDTVPLQITLPDTGIVVEGTVYDPYGQPMPYAEVALTEFDLVTNAGGFIDCIRHVTARVRADAVGAYRLPHVRTDSCADGMFEIAAKAPVGPYHVEVDGRARIPHVTEIIDLRTVGRGVVSGRVTYEDGTVPDDLQVTAWNPVQRGGRLAWTDTAGNYRMADVMVGTVTLTAWDTLGHRVYRTIEVETAGSEVTQDLVIIRRPGADTGTGSVHGVVTDFSTGEPAVDSYIALYVDDVLLGVRRGGIDGSYDFGWVPAGQARLQAFDATTGRRAAQVLFELTRDLRQQVDLALRDERGAIEGTVTRRFADGTTQPVEDAVVWVEGTPFHTETAADGSYRLDDVYAGTWTVHVADLAANETVFARTTVQQPVAGQPHVAVLPLVFQQNLDLEGGIYGTVVGDDGQPVAGAIVHLAGDYSSTHWHHEATSDANGRFHIADLGPGTYGVHAFKGAVGGIGWADLRFPGDSVDITVAMRTGTVEGRVFVRDGATEVPVVATIVYNGVEVVQEWGVVAFLPEPRRAITEDDGTFSLPLLHGPFSLTVHNAFHGSENVSGVLDDLTQPLEIEFDALGAIRGVLYDHDGITPVAGADVQLVGGSFSDYTVTTDSAGAFLFDLVPTGGYRVTATRDDGVVYRTARVYARVVNPGDELDIEVVLQAQGTVEGEVLDADGAAVPGAVVTLRERAFPWRELTHNADADGRFVFQNIFGGEVFVGAQAPSLGGLGGKADGEILAEGEELFVSVSLEGTGTITGTILNPGTGGPAPGARVRLVKSGFNRVVDVAHADTDGRFRFELIKLGSYTAHVFDPTTGRHGRGTGLTLTSHGETLEQDIALEVRGSVDGTLYDPPTNHILPGETIRLESRGLRWFTTFSSTDIDGAFRFDGIPEGDVIVSTRVDRRRAVNEGRIEFEDQLLTLDLYLDPLASIRGVVLAPATGPADLDPTLAQGLNLVARQGTTVIGAGFDNPFDFTGFARGTVSLTAEELAGDHELRHSLAVDVGEQVDLTLRLPGIGSVTVEVYDSLGAPVPGADVSLFSKPHGEHLDTCQRGVRNEAFLANTGAGHTAEFQPVRAGSFRVQVTDPATGTRGAASGCLLWEGEHLAVPVTLEPTGSITGTVTLPGGGPAVGAAVALKHHGAGWDWLVLQTDELGAFAFDSLPLGAYDLELDSADGAASYSLSGSLDADQEVDHYDLTLDDASPRVVSFTPAAGSRDLPLDTVFRVELSEPIRRNDGAFKFIWLGGGWPPPDYHVVYSDNDTVATLVPAQPLTSDTGYKVTVRAELEDLAGRPMGENVIAGFYTADVEPPTVLSIDPADGEGEVPLASALAIVFDEPIDPSQVAGVQLVDLGSGTPLGATALFTHDDRRLVLTLLGGLTTDTHYEVRVTGVRDVPGNVMTEVVTSRFWTVDTTPPAITLQSPSSAQLFTAGDAIDVLADVTDARGVASVRFELGGWSRELTAAPWHWTAPAPIAGQTGEVTLRIVATDVHGNVAEATRQIVVEPLANASAPTITEACPQAADFVAPGLELPITFGLHDDEAIESYRLRVDGVEVGAVSPVPGFPDAASLETDLLWTPPTDATPGQSFELELEARDFAGNVAVHALTLHVPAAGLRTDGGAIDGSSGAVYLASAEFGLGQAFAPGAAPASITLLHGATLRSPVGVPVASTGALTLQCGASAEIDAITAGQVVLDGRSTARLRGGVVADALTVRSAAHLEQLPQWSDEGSGDELVNPPMHFDIAGTMSVESDAIVAADRTGFAHGPVPEAHGFAPSGVEVGAGGGAHGGAGWTDDRLGAAFDSIVWPVHGGGGGWHTPWNLVAYAGGDGGGVLSIEAAELILDGTLSADGGLGDGGSLIDGVALDTSGAGGAGGTIRLDVGRLAGTGTMHADGADAKSRPGGGGRIAIHTDLLDGFDPMAQAQARGGRSNSTDPQWQDHAAGPGSVYVKTPASIHGDLVVDTGPGVNPQLTLETENPTLRLPMLGSLAPAAQSYAGDTLLLTVDPSPLGVEALARWRGARALLLDSAGDELGTFAVTDVVGADLHLAGAAVHAGQVVTIQGRHHFDRITLRGAFHLALGDAVYADEITVEGTILPMAPIHAGDLVVRAGAALAGTSPWSHPAPVAVDLRLEGDLTIEAGGAIDVAGAGYADPHVAPGQPALPAGPGGSHGGLGGQATAAAGHEAYDSVYRPTLAGGAGVGIQAYAGSGGGIVLVRASHVRLDGTIDARGVTGTAEWRAGAGGTVSIDATSLAGLGNIDAGSVDLDGVAAGGGRIALHVDDLSGFDLASVRANAGQSSGSAHLPAQPGTILVHDAGSTWGDLYVLGQPSSTPLEPLQLPTLGSGTPVAQSAQGADLRLELAAAPLARWLGAPVRLLDATDAELGVYRVATIEGSSLILDGAGAHAGQVASYEGVYRFDRVVVEHVEEVDWTGIEADHTTLGGEILAPPVLTAKNLTLTAGTTLTPTSGGSLTLDVEGTLVIANGAVLDVDALGYPGGNNGADGGAPAGVVGAHKEAGGSHGGVGHYGGFYGAPGDVFDSVYLPVEGGGGSSITGYGSPGGGTITLHAHDLVLDGLLTARGGPEGHGGGGGAALVEATGQLSGTGSIDVRGGDATSHAGGGGRVALYVDTLSGFDPAVQVHTEGGTATTWADGTYGGAGTLLVHTAASMHGTLLVDATGTTGTDVGGLATPLPRLGFGTIGEIEVSADDPADLWIEPLDPAQTVGHGMVGVWARIDDADSAAGSVGIDYRILDQTADLRRVLLAGAAGAIEVGDTFRGVYKFDEVVVAGGADLVFDDFDEVAVWTVDPSSTVTRRDMVPPQILSATPADLSTFTSGAALGIAATVSDDVAVASVTFRLDGPEVAESFVDTAAPFEWSLLAPQVAVSTDFAYSVVVRDTNDNTDRLDRTLTVDPNANLTPPTLSPGGCPGPFDGTDPLGIDAVHVEPGATISFPWSAVDDESLQAVELWIDGALVDSATALDVPSASGSLSWTVPAGASPGTAFTAVLTARDYASGSTSASLRLVVPTAWLAGDQTLDQPVDGQTLILGAGTHTSTVVLRPARLILMRGAVLTAPATPASTEPSALAIEATGRITIECGAAISADGLGYFGGLYPDASATAPGVPGAQRNSGGSHGGRGSWGSSSYEPPGDPFDSVYLPAQAGGAGGSKTYPDALGAPGGGILTLSTPALDLRGDLRARGADGGLDATHRGAGAGAGGAILVDAVVLRGAGRVDVAGGDAGQFNSGGVWSTLSGGGGGGRIALYVDDLGGFDPSSQIIVTGGLATDRLGNDIAAGASGTAFLFDAASTYGRLVVDQQNQGSQATPETLLARLGSGTVGVAEADTVDPAALWIEPLDGGHRFELGVVGAWLRVDGVDYRIVEQASDRRILLDGATGFVQVGDAYAGIYKFDQITVSGSAELTVDDLIEGVTADPIAVTTTPIAAATEGDWVAAAATFAAPASTRHTASVDWGDGVLEPALVTESGNGTGSVEAVHVYADDGLYTVTLCVVGELGQRGCGAQTVSVVNAPPTSTWLDLGQSLIDIADGTYTLPVWTVSADGREAEQTANSRPSVLITNASSHDTRIEAVLSHDTTSGDYMGLAFGIEPGELTSPSADYLLLSWKRSTSSLWGVRLYRVRGVLSSFWDPSYAPEAELLATATTFGATARQDRTEYAFAAETTDDRFRLWVDGALEIDVTAPVGDGFPRGYFGLYAYRQWNADFRDVRIGPIPSDGRARAPFSQRWLDLSTFTGESVDPGQNKPASWTVSADGRQVEQRVNSEATFFASPEPLHGRRLELKMYPVRDNDYFGLAFGYDAGEANQADADYLLAVWKRDDEAGALRGLRVYRIAGELSDWWALQNAPEATLLASGATLGDQPWTAGRSYTMRAELDAERLRLWIDGSLEIDVTAPVGSPFDDQGSYALYSNGQDWLRVRDLSLHGLLVAEGASAPDLAVPLRDPGAADVHSATIDWGDGILEPASVLQNAGQSLGQALALEVTGRVPGPAPVEVCVTDDDGATHCEQVPLSVTVEPPVIDPGGAETATTGTLFTLTRSFTDGVLAGAYTVAVDWGDSSQSIGSASHDGSVGSAQATHTYSTPATYTVALCVSDEDGVTGCADITVDVTGASLSVPQAPPPPTSLHATDAAAACVDAGRDGPCSDLEGPTP